MSDEELEHMARSAGLLDVIDDAYLARGDWLPEARAFASLAQSAELERCAQYLLDAAKGLPPYTAHVLACKGDELAAGRAWREVGEGEKK